jgi:hypothetical protein
MGNYTGIVCVRTSDVHPDFDIVTSGSDYDGKFIGWFRIFKTELLKSWCDAYPWFNDRYGKAVDDELAWKKSERYQELLNSSTPSDFGKLPERSEVGCNYNHDSNRCSTHRHAPDPFYPVESCFYDDDAFEGHYHDFGNQ